MNPLVAEYIGLLPVSPIDHVWFDTRTGSDLMESYSGFLEKYKHSFSEEMNFKISELPMPFDKIGLMLSIANKPDATLEELAMVPILVERVGSTIYLRQYILGLKEPACEFICKDFLLEKDGGIVKIKGALNFHDKYLKALKTTKYDEDVTRTQMVFFESAAKKLSLLCYGIPNQGSKVSGFSLSCTPKELQINAKRIRKGKAQFFEWRTVELKTNPEPKEYASLGGTHASPKPHDRRGHQRRYKNGKVVYVRSSTINKHKIAEEGFIQHDYKIVGDKPKQKKGASVIQSIVEGIKNLFKEKSYERVSEVESR